MALSIKDDAAGPKRLSEKRYQIAACVSAMARIIKSRNGENWRTFLPGFDRFLQQKEQGRIWQADRVENGWVPWESRFLKPLQGFCESLHVQAHPQTVPLRGRGLQAWLLPAVQAPN